MGAVGSDSPRVVDTGSTQPGDNAIQPLDATPEPVEEIAPPKINSHPKRRRTQPRGEDGNGGNAMGTKGGTILSVADSLAHQVEVRVGSGLELAVVGDDEASSAASSGHFLSKSPKGLYHLAPSTIPQSSNDPLPRSSKNGGLSLGFVMSTKGDYRVHFARREGRGPPHRASVLFGGDLPRDARVPLARPTDLAEVDRRLGYQVPRVWFPNPRPLSAAPQLDAPAERPSPLARAMRPHTSGLIRNEYYRLETHKKYLELSEQDPEHPLSLLRSPDLKRSRLGDSADVWAQWSPGPGIAPGHGSKAMPISPTRVPPSVPHADGAKFPTRVPLAGYAYQGMGLTPDRRRRLAWTDEVDAPSEAKPPARRGRRARQAEVLDDDRVLPPPPSGSLVLKEDLVAARQAQASTKAAAKAVSESLVEAKTHQKQMRLRSIIHAPELSSDELKEVGGREHSSFMSVLEQELKSVLAHKAAIQQEMVSEIELQHQALPLRFLFTIPGGPAYCRTRLRRAFSYWIAEFEKNQCVVALALWRILVDRQKFKEATRVYHKDAGSSKLTAIMYKMQLALKARVLAKLRNKVGWVIFEHRDRSVVVIQRMVRRVRGLQRFLWMHDTQPFGGLLADIDMDECRFLSKQVVPRVRDDKRRFWRAAIRIQTVWRMVIHVRWWRALRAANVVKLQALIRVAPVRRVFRRLRKAAVVMEALVRMVLARWPYLRWVVNARTLQRVVRGHSARVVAFRRYLARRALSKVAITTMPDCLV